MNDLTGKVIAGRYRVDASLGRGGMGDVYKVWDRRRAAFLAMKAIHPDMAEDKVFLRRFAREAETLSVLQHPNIVRFYGMEQDGGLSFMLMDYVEGTTLRKLIFDSHAPFSPERVLQVAVPICSALHYAHEMGIAHCDMKPANVMVKPSGEILVADFGIARMMETGITTSMKGMGTPSYMAPEQVSGKKPQPQTDIYAMGIILYEMLTGGERPFTGERAQTDGSAAEKICWEQVNAPPPPPRIFNRDISRAMETAVMTCLEKDPSKRYASALDLSQALENAVENADQSRGLATEPTRADLPIAASNPPNESKPASKFPIWGIGAAALIVILSLFGLFTMNGQTAIPTPTITQHIIPTPLLIKDATDTPMPTITPSPVPTLGVGSTMVSERDGMTLLYVPAGKFKMGNKAENALAECQQFNSDCKLDWFKDEEPPHEVELSAFWMDQTEVTNAMYARCVSASACAAPISPKSLTYPSYYGNAEFDNYPVIYVSWNMAKTYCAWAGRDLPTEAQWEKAARGPDANMYPWGNIFDGDRVNFCDKNCPYAWANKSFDDGYADVSPVGSYPSGKSFYGAYDMAGNVWEWMNDWYDAMYYPNSPASNPLGPDAGSLRALRGGSWSYTGSNVRSALRLGGDPLVANEVIGFRCATSQP